MNENISILKIRTVQERTGLSRSSIYAYITDGRFPKPIKIGARSVGWNSKSIDQWIDSKIDEMEGKKHAN